ncbi:mycofactocin system transcriptional regulator [Kineosporia sp. J2-2]|uniref:Mycofactocin system transcriptional regulator n=1 Tax=Kineosporia corallincola TaxID=2835133 RepID=A0ABS5TN39_9ACTN|nr:mycofactocin system transcriptional regulator [Kineosporia corallincola]MBT0772505.1 mycofactocin system transcriptional regulator [Kineosporia corallincola]
MTAGSAEPATPGARGGRKAAPRGENRSGRPRATSRRTLERIALELFSEQGFEATTVEQIADRAGVSRRTFFRYFDTKADVLWSEFDAEVETLHELLAQAPADQPLTEAIRQAVLTANHYGVDDIAGLHTRMSVVAHVPALNAASTAHYDNWAGALAEFAARRLGLRPDDLIPQAIGFSALGVCRAAFDQWVARRDGDLISYLDIALSAWKTGFSGFEER